MRSAWIQDSFFMYDGTQQSFSDWNETNGISMLLPFQDWTKPSCKVPLCSVPTLFRVGTLSVKKWNNLGSIEPHRTMISWLFWKMLSGFLWKVDEASFTFQHKKSWMLPLWLYKRDCLPSWDCHLTRLLLFSYFPWKCQVVYSSLFAFLLWLCYCVQLNFQPIFHAWTHAYPVHLLSYSYCFLWLTEAETVLSQVSVFSVERDVIQMFWKSMLPDLRSVVWRM